MSSSPNQPRKKRRIDPQDRRSNVSPENLPLVSPNEVPKSSKDPNRGMYPRRNDRSKNKRSLSCPTFSKASKLLKESSDSKTHEKECEVSNISLAEISIEEDGSPLRKSSKFVPDIAKQSQAHTSSAPMSRKIFRKSKFPVVNFANKILNYFKPTPSATAKKKDKESTNITSDDILEASCSSSYVETPKAETNKSLLEMRNETFFQKFRNCYGLLGEANEADEFDSPNYFNRLPCHVLESILCQIPFLDLMKCRLVCTTLNYAINDTSFMPWKKLYYGLKLNRQSSFDQVERLCKSYGLSVVEDCFGVLIKYMSEGFVRRPSPNMYEFLSENAKSVEAELVLAERFPQVLTKESKVWCIFATTMLLSETVEDVHGLYRTVITKQSDCSLHDVTSAMYCVATFLLYFRNVHGINHGLHYRVYNALYWIENRLPSKEIEGTQSLRVTKGLPGQQSIHNYCEASKSSLTYEQLRILNHCFQPSQILKIVALAGTGKTTTLIHLAQLYPQVKFLNVMFNKAVCEDARKRFPPNVTCRTAHSLAYTLFGNRLRYKLSNRIRPHDIVTFVLHNGSSSMNIHSYSRHVLATIENFVASSEEEIKLLHVPTSHVDGIMRVISEDDRHRIVKDSKQIWEKMIDRDNKNLRITHDVYLKLYQLSKPQLSEYQCLMVDEAQDCNPAMLDIMMSQNLPVILVGDPNQQIYGFRGANNALQSIEATHTYHLTKSFRFGPEIAYIASCCLEVLKLNKKETLVGSNKPSFIDGRTEGQYAIIARTNVQLFNEAVRLCCLKRYRDHEPHIVLGAFAGGLSGYGFDQMLDICKLANHSDGPVPALYDKFICKFKSYKDLSNYAKSVEDNELLAKIDLVNQHGSRIPELLSTIKEQCKHPMALANVVFTTAHKAKGLEFDTVCVTDDYPIAPGIEYRRRRPIDCEESNIMYVALTRAKKCLLLPDKLLRVLLAAQEKFEYPTLPSKILGDRTELKCINCEELFTPHTVLILARRKIVAASGRLIEGGALCVKCSSEPTVRPRVQIEPVVMYLDPTADYAHRSMSALVGPLPSDPPIVRNSFGAFPEMDVIYVINLNIN